ncbi:class I SAM-dependent methyltransferase [Paenibacillus sp. UNC451MF]|uniref:class I SAM-dependent methyltransferase n=1 Tax=Paenibacillus sp. UNC451MF TaxID=1449063 RepID=UPI00048FCCD7|nr:class I SAM-dependent methyltransferase [Paenibacillus sp. UNC451MF]
MKHEYNSALKSPTEFWIQAWEQAAAEDLRVGSDTEEEKYWVENAAAYDDRNPLAQYTEPIMNRIYEHLNPNDHLLEIGPGTGGFTQLLAPHVGEIALIEPSAAMYKELCANWINVRTSLPTAILTKWEESPKVEADIVFGANAFYRIKDMKSSLMKMHETARRHVFLIQSIGRPFAGPLRVTENDRSIEKERADVLSGILHEMNITHQYEKFPTPRKNGMIHDVALIHWSR